jgi:hypothetical protein
MAPESIPSNLQAVQPCAICRRETAIGSLLHATRRRLSDLDGRDIYVCADCHEAARATRGGEPLSDDDLRSFVRTASLAGIAWGRG